MENIDPLLIERLENYHAGSLSASEKQSVDDLLKSDDFNAEANVYFDIFDGFAGLELEAFEQQMNNWESKHQIVQQQETTLKVVTKKSFFQRYKLAVAAAILALALPVGFLMMQNNTEQQLFSDNFTMMENLSSPINRDVDENAEVIVLKLNSKVNEAIFAFNDQQYDKARDLFMEYRKQVAISKQQFPAVAKTHNFVDDALFYIGLIDLKKGKTTEAIDAFNAIDRELMTVDALEARDWYLALAHLQQKNSEKANAVLQEILKDEAHNYYTKAAALSSKLQE